MQLEQQQKNMFKSDQTKHQAAAFNSIYYPLWPDIYYSNQHDSKLVSCHFGQKHFLELVVQWFEKQFYCKISKHLKQFGNEFGPKSI